MHPFSGYCNRILSCSDYSPGTIILLLLFLSFPQQNSVVNERYSDNVIACEKRRINSSNAAKEIVTDVKL